MKQHRTCITGLLSTLLVAATLNVSAPDTALSCTGIDFSLPTHKNLGGRYAFAGRTMEFGPDVAGWKLLYVPKNYNYQSCKLSGLVDTCGDVDKKMISGYSWPAKYAYVGFTPMRHIVGKLDYTLNEINDGINEKGLYCGGFYHMGTEEYSKVPIALGQKNISNMDFQSWVLGQFSSVTELENVLNNENDPRYVQVRQFSLEVGPGNPIMNPDKFPQLHYKVVDQTGAAIVIEFVKGKPKIFNSVGVITNNPTYDWHMTNLHNYVGLQDKNHESVQFMGKTYGKLSNGTGAIGLPGDFTSTSRFIRAMFFLNSTLTNNKIASPEEAVLRSFRVLNQFDIPEGSVVETKPDNPDKVTTMEATSWTSMADLTNLRYYYHTMNSRSIRMIDLGDLMKRIPVSSKPVTIDVPASETIIDVTDQFKVK